jgi:hypothetical protein
MGVSATGSAIELTKSRIGQDFAIFAISFLLNR